MIIQYKLSELLKLKELSKLLEVKELIETSNLYPEKVEDVKVTLGTFPYNLHDINDPNQYCYITLRVMFEDGKDLWGITKFQVKDHKDPVEESKIDIFFNEYKKCLMKELERYNKTKSFGEDDEFIHSEFQIDKYIKEDLS